MGMNSYYFAVKCYKRKKLQWVVEMENLSRLAKFVITSEGNRTMVSPECTIEISKQYVSVTSGTRLEMFGAVKCDELKQMALRV